MNKTPKLRFPEFSGEWKEKKLGSLCTFLKGSGLSKDDISTEGKPCILYGELYTKYGEVISKVYSKTNLEGENFVYSKQNDVLIPSSGETAIDIATASSVQYDGVILGGDLNIMRSIEINGIFLSYQLNNAKRNDVAKVAQGASVVHIYNDQLKKINVDVPERGEQEKLASFFSLIDKKIEKQQEKVKALEEYKKGIMQKIFSQEIRFKDENGEEYPEWEEKSLGNYLIEHTEKTIENNQYPVLTSSRSGLVLQKDYFSDRQVTTEENIGYNIIPYGYVTFRSRSDDGTFRFNQNNIIEKGIVSYFYPVFTFNEKIDSYYALIYMNNYLKKQILREIVGTSQLVLSLNKLKQLKIKLPLLEEQQRIGRVLYTIDKKNEKEKEKLDQLKEWKKSLLQQMFV